MKLENKLAVLITCHNRKDTTLRCLRALYSAHTPQKLPIEVFLVDDGSTDGTSDAIKKQFPKIKIIKGTGNLYWNGGMRLAWKVATSSVEYKYYLWLNDDTTLDKSALMELLECYHLATSKYNKPAIIAGACRSSESGKQFSYGGKTDLGPVIPNGKLETCKYINGNATLIPNEVYKVLGNLSPDYTHSIGDYDYGLRAQKLGFQCYSTRIFVAICPLNQSYLDWSSSSKSLITRLRLMNSPKGLNIKEYLIFRKKFWGWKWVIFAVKAYSRVILPGFYSRLKTSYYNH